MQQWPRNHRRSIVNGVQVVADAILVSRNCFRALESVWLAVVPAASGRVAVGQDDALPLPGLNPLGNSIDPGKSRCDLGPGSYTAVAE